MDNTLANIKGESVNQTYQNEPSAAETDGAKGKNRRVKPRTVCKVAILTALTLTVSILAALPILFYHLPTVSAPFDFKRQWVCTP